MKEYGFDARVFVRGKIRVKTGLSIGAGKEGVKIGGVDSPVIRDPEGYPFIPGSSLKGKMRCSLERVYSEDHPTIKKLFGTAGDKNKENTEGFSITALYVRDAFVNKFNEKGEKKLPYEFYEEKTEVKINRKSGKSEGGLRTTERVVPGTEFNFEMVLTVWNGYDGVSLLEKLLEGLRLVQDEYLGGSGSRGYGQVEFVDLEFSIKTPEHYREGKEAEVVKEKVSLDESAEALWEEIKKKASVCGEGG